MKLSWLLSREVMGSTFSDAVLDLASSSTSADRAFLIKRLADHWECDGAEAWDRWISLKNLLENQDDPDSTPGDPRLVLVAVELSALNLPDQPRAALGFAKAALASASRSTYRSPWEENSTLGLALACSAAAISHCGDSETGLLQAQESLSLASGGHLARSQYLAAQALMIGNKYSDAARVLALARAEFQRRGDTLHALKAATMEADSRRYASLSSDQEILQLLVGAEELCPSGYRGLAYQSLCLSIASTLIALGKLALAEDRLDSIGPAVSRQIAVARHWQRGLIFLRRGENVSATTRLGEVVAALREIGGRADQLACATCHLASAQLANGDPSCVKTARKAAVLASELGLPEIERSALMVLESSSSSAIRQV